MFDREVLRQKREAQIEVDDVFVHRGERIERQRHPAVDVDQVGHLSVTLRAERIALHLGVGRIETHRIEVHHVLACAAD